MPTPRVWDDRPQSPLEELFLHGAQKYAYPDLTVLSQQPVETPHGNFFLDVQGTTKGGRVLGFELDGREYHDAERDLWRDAAILATGHCEAIYRITGRDLVRQAARVWYLLSRLERAIVSDRNRQVLEQLAGRDRPETVIELSEDGAWMQFYLERHEMVSRRLEEMDEEEVEELFENDPPWDVISVARRTKDTPEVQECVRWLAAACRCETALEAPPPAATPRHSPTLT
ncbi:MAG TPA: hypothetical protein VIQ27_15275 [Gemmatimonadales bacterium]